MFARDLSFSIYICLSRIM